MANKENETLVVAGTAALVLLSGVVGTIFILAVMRSWVIVSLWRWYMVPGFNLPNITIAAAFGLSLLFGFLSPIKDGGNIKDAIKNSIIRMLIVLVLGWIGSWFM